MSYIIINTLLDSVLTCVDKRDCKPVEYPPFQPPLSTDLLTSLSLTNTNHAENQFVHLQLPHSTEGDTLEARESRRHHVEVNVGTYGGLLGRACPAGVYEYVEQEGEAKAVEDEGWGGEKLVINSQVSSQSERSISRHAD